MWQKLGDKHCAGMGKKEIIQSKQKRETRDLLGQDRSECVIMRE